jgi:hypothetical protein
VYHLGGNRGHGVALLGPRRATGESELLAPPRTGGYLSAMGNAWKSFGGAAGALSFTLASASAVAQPLPLDTTPEGPSPSYEVKLRGASPGAIWEIYPPTGDIEQQKPLARCGEKGCTLQMKQGRYRLWVQGAEGTSVGRGYREFDVHSDMDLTVRGPNRVAKGGGLALAIVGKVSFVSGMFVALFGSVADCSSCDTLDDNWCTCEADRAIVNTGLGMMLAGAIAIPVGWVTFGRNRRPKIESNFPSSPTAWGSPPLEPGTARLEFGVQRLGPGYALGSRVAF